LKLFELGRVARPHGVSGELRVALHNPESRTLLDVDSVVLRNKRGTEREYRVVGARAVNKAALLRLDGVADRDAAEVLRGQSVLVPRSAIPAPEDGEYYLLDLVGVSVHGPNGPLGEVVEVRVHPTVDSIVIRRPDGELLEQPLVEPWIESVDVEAGSIVLSSLDGLV
jgi:16S rRNA processing protein RimM